ncbi:hypothetical protein BC937DRAFT_88657 [Endogone sp. FLAS-F59071]|nr:hypothetical protein BC937DRAFT_88657 [Endogone sp. FLAS-F59071]|eukprot:RUS22514.1 hypothetical protein BC937DRAFT_88657 [Endogone sp. FLAS-F59071]
MNGTRASATTSLLGSPIPHSISSSSAHPETLDFARGQHDVAQQNYHHPSPGFGNASPQLFSNVGYSSSSPVLPPPPFLRNVTDFAPVHSSIVSIRQLEETPSRVSTINPLLPTERLTNALEDKEWSHFRQRSSSMCQSIQHGPVDSLVQYTQPSFYKNWGSDTASARTLLSSAQSQSQPTVHYSPNQHRTYPSPQPVSSLQPSNAEYERERRKEAKEASLTYDMGKFQPKKNITVEFKKVVQNCNALAQFAAQFGELESAIRPEDRPVYVSGSSSSRFDAAVSKPPDAVMIEMANRAYDVLQVLMRIKSQTDNESQSVKPVPTLSIVHTRMTREASSNFVSPSKIIVGNGTEEDDMDIIRNKRTSSVSNSPARSKYRKRSKRAAPPGRCHSCNISETPEWRRGPDGARTLCNACGLHFAKLTRKRALQNPSSPSDTSSRSGTTTVIEEPLSGIAAVEYLGRPLKFTLKESRLNAMNEVSRR